MKKQFKGMQEYSKQTVPLPGQFFSEILPNINSLAELKLILYTMEHLHRQEGSIRFIQMNDFIKDIKDQDENLIDEQTIYQAFESLQEKNILLRGENQKEIIFFFNSPKGRAALKSLQAGEWHPEAGEQITIQSSAIDRNIFQLYEENIGTLTPIIVDTLKDAEEEYPETWIKDAIQIAVQKNVRNWRYIEAILQSWQKEGRYEKDRRNTEKDRKKYIEDEYSDFIQH